MIRTLAVLGLTACHVAHEGRPPITTCTSSLAGTWRAPGADPDQPQTWAMIDNGATLEAYPLFVDATASVSALSAPRVIDLRRDASGAGGTVTRRYQRGPTACVAKAPVHLVACHDDTLEVVIADPAEPVFIEGDGDDTKCLAGSTPPSRRERWTATW
ncbi:MAG: hypothetical protein NT062_35980 [Proteobacteria bacterium]|nr:hypothetical protein [Pseudomonadota bacterium]